MGTQNARTYTEFNLLAQRAKDLRAQRYWGAHRVSVGTHGSCVRTSHGKVAHRMHGIHRVFLATNFHGWTLIPCGDFSRKDAKGRRMQRLFFGAQTPQYPLRSLTLCPLCEKIKFCVSLWFLCETLRCGWRTHEPCVPTENPITSAVFNSLHKKIHPRGADGFLFGRSGLFFCCFAGNCYFETITEDYDTEAC